MRRRFGCLTLTPTLALFLALAACVDARDQRAADWRCGPVQGLEALTGERSPAWIFVGELTETAEAPAAIADIACNLATDEHKLFVGVTDYAGGATDAETKMLASLNAMIAKGAPIVVGHIGESLSITRDRTNAEKSRARSLAQQVAASGANRALLFVPRADAIVTPIAPIGERFAGFTPMPVFLEGGVVSLEIAPYATGHRTGPEIRIYAEARNGFDGLLALSSLTRPSLALVLPERKAEPAEPQESGPPGPDDQMRRVPTFNFGDISPITEAEYQALYDEVLQAIPDHAPD